MNRFEAGDALASAVRAYLDDGAPELELSAALADYDEVVEQQEDEQENYTGPDPVVKCAYQPCTNHLRRSAYGGPQWCSITHREMTG